MRFVSIVGTQVMAVLNPLLAIRSEEGIRVDEVSLLATEHRKSGENAEKLRDYLVKGELYDPSRVIIERICSTPESDLSLPQAHDVLRDLVAAGQICFNVGGGMNYQVGLCVGILKTGRDIFVYPESNGIHLFGIGANNRIARRLLPLPNPIDILTLLHLQGIEAKDNRPQASYFPWKLLKEKKIRLPEPNAKQIRIGTVQFDAVWNRGNELCFLKAAWKDFKRTKTAEERLTDSRALARLATGRKGFAELYHRNIAVLTNDRTVAARYREEAGNKVIVIDFSTKKSAAFTVLKNFLRDTKQETASGISPTTIQIPGRTPREETLALTLGPNLMPTLMAIWSHRPGKIIFFYTPGDDVVERYRQAIKDHVSLLPPEVAVLEFRPISINGLEIFESVPPDTFVVNITPGGKSHGACLALWARLHGGKIFSLRTTTGTLYRLDIPEGPLSGPSPPDCLLLAGARIESLGKDVAALDQWDAGDPLLRLLRSMIAEKIPIKRFGLPAGKIETSDLLCYFSQDKDCILKEPGTPEPIVLNLGGGEWFEELVGYVLRLYGADDVQVRLRTRWPEEVERKLNEKYPGKELFLSDLDVVVRFGGDYLLISCKARPLNKKEAEATAEQAAAQAQLFGIFCLPLVCGLFHQGEPIRSKANIPIFGYQTLVDEQSMLALIRQRFSEVRKTA